MNKLLYYIVVTCTAFLISSCSDSGKTTEETAPEPVDQPITPQNVTTGTEATAEIQSGDGSESAPVSEPMTIQPAAAAQVSGGTAASGPLNPPHGQPGHRCEIAVGAPLNSAPTQTGTVTNSGPTTLPTAEQGSVTQQIQIPTDASGQAPKSIMDAPAPAQSIPATPGQATTTTAPGMNPPHGQPGHDCNIAVGAPLKK